MSLWRVQSVNSHRGEAPQGRHPRNCRHFCTLACCERNRDRSPEQVARGGRERKKTIESRRSQKKSWEEVLKQVLRDAGSKEVAKGDVAKGRLKRRSRAEVMKGCREKRS